MLRTTEHKCSDPQCSIFCTHCTPMMYISNAALLPIVYYSCSKHAWLCTRSLRLFVNHLLNTYHHAVVGCVADYWQNWNLIVCLRNEEEQVKTWKRLQKTSSVHFRKFILHYIYLQPSLSYKMSGYHEQVTNQTTKLLPSHYKTIWIY